MNTEELEQKLAEAQRDVAMLREVLVFVERCGNDDVDEAFCPACFQVEGHQHNCKIGQALTQTEAASAAYEDRIKAEALREVAESFEDGGYFFDSEEEPEQYKKYDLVYAKALRYMAADLEKENGE